MAPAVLELGDVLLHDMDVPRMLERIHQFRNMGEYRVELGPCLVRYMYVPIYSTPMSAMLTLALSATRIYIGASVGIPAASLCINRRLYKIARMHAVAVTRSEVRRLLLVVRNLLTITLQKRRAILIDSLICVAFPLVCIALCEGQSRIDHSRANVIVAYIVQGHRFNIFEIIGCFPAIYNTVPAYPLVYMWPVAIGTVSAVYCSTSRAIQLFLSANDST